MNTLTRSDLDQLRCDNGCDDHPLILHSLCHPDDPAWVWYDKRTGKLSVECATCEQPIVEIAVGHATSQ